MTQMAYLGFTPHPSPTVVKSNAARPYWWMLTGAFFFSCMGILAHLLRNDIPWQVIALVRTSLALIFSVAIVWTAGAKLAILRPRTLWVRSIAGSCSLLLTFYALTHATSLAEVLVLCNMFPVWIALLSGPVLGSWPAGDTWVAIGCGLLGVVIIQQPKLAVGEYALLAAALGSFTTSIAMLGLHRLKHLHPSSIVAHFSGVSVLFCLGALWFAPYESVVAVHSNTTNLIALASLGITATLGQLFLTKAFAAGSPARVSVVGLSQVAFTALADVVIWHRQFYATTIVGMAFIVLPTLWLLLRSSSPDTPEVLPDEPAVVPPVE